MNANKQTNQKFHIFVVDTTVLKTCHARKESIITIKDISFPQLRLSLSLPGVVFLRACLNLIEDRPSTVQEEFNLIAALGLLDDFNVSILPLQGNDINWTKPGGSHNYYRLPPK